MLNEHTLDQLRGLRLDGMVQALADDATRTAAAKLSFDERLAMLVQREVDWRDGKRLARLLKAAKLKVSSACIEDINWRGSRGLDRGLITQLAGCDWLRHGHNVLLTRGHGLRQDLACMCAGPAGGTPGIRGAVHTGAEAAGGTSCGSRRRILQPALGTTGAH